LAARIKHDGYRMVARRDAVSVRLFTRNGHDWTARFPSVVEAVGALKIKSCILDGEITVCRPDGVTSFDLLRTGRKIKPEAVLHVFDLIELDGDDLRREPIEMRKQRLRGVLRHHRPAVQFNEHLQEADGEEVFHHACLMGLEGIVSKRLGSPYQSGHSRHWLKSKNPNCEAVRREAEEEWGR
jgi:bifunctional non-homologous end joining protein LigD